MNPETSFPKYLIVLHDYRGPKEVRESKKYMSWSEAIAVLFSGGFMRPISPGGFVMEENLDIREITHQEITDLYNAALACPKEKRRTVEESFPNHETVTDISKNGSC